jgi:cell shape-determining protein MreD
MAAACNFSIPQNQCTLETCCLEQSDFLYIPSFGCNLFFTIYFAVAMAPQIWLACTHRTWSFAIAICMGLIIEVVGYAGRLMLHEDPFDGNGFLM